MDISKSLVGAALAAKGMQNFTVSLVTNYTADHAKGKSCVYVEGLDLLSADKRRRVIETITRNERRLRRQLPETTG